MVGVGSAGGQVPGDDSGDGVGIGWDGGPATVGAAFFGPMVTVMFLVVPPWPVLTVMVKVSVLAVAWGVGWLRRRRGRAAAGCR